jgi:hypothetical protein
MRIAIPAPLLFCICGQQAYPLGASGPDRILDRATRIQLFRQLRLSRVDFPQNGGRGNAASSLTPSRILDSGREWHAGRTRIAGIARA